MNNLTKRLIWLLDREEQRKRPKKERFKYRLQNGLHLRVNEIGPMAALLMYRIDVPPSHSEIETVGKSLAEIFDMAMLDIEITLTSAAVVKRHNGRDFHCRYIMWSETAFDVTTAGEYQQPPLLVGLEETKEG